MLKKIKDKKTEDRILESAKKIFYNKGIDGARMQEIADEARINKAMLHYYFRNKEALFDAVFKEATQKIFPQVIEILNMEKPLFEKIEYFTDKYITLLSQNPIIPVFVIREMNNDPDKFLKTFSERIKIKPEIFIRQIREAIKSEEILPVDPVQLFINLISLCIFPFLARPLISNVFGMNEAGFEKFLNKRKKEIPEFIINSIRI
ncbi:MAG TPA: TetR/AcrR family transcriptional regulator [Ignavibacteria bacterium]|nr:TetR/AcrR family transcriptional regulator [Ignavibacteria bacterium]HRA98930.1 TetR/AcrR family transcriptional regulator [Ignavibacteria bacterium]